MSIDAVILFFILGCLIQLARVDFAFPKGLSQSLSIFLLLAIGIKGGLALNAYFSLSLVFQGLTVIASGIVIPFIAYGVLRYFGQLPLVNAANIAAHYGSVSVGTYAVAVSMLDAAGIQYEGYFSLFVVLLEIPAIAVGIWLARNHISAAQKRGIAREMFLNTGVALLLGGILVGLLAGESIVRIEPLYKDLFPTILALFLLDMGCVAGARLRQIGRDSAFICNFGMAIPLFNGVIGALLGHFVLAFSAGGTVLLAVLSASCSYIAVPAVMRTVLPQANHGLSMTASLGVTFPFNVLVGIPIFIALAQFLNGGFSG